MPVPGDKKPETLFEPRFIHPGILLVPIILTPSAILIAAMITRFHFNGPAPLVMVGMVIAAILSIVGYWVWKLGRMRKLIRTHGRFLCLNCHYPLTGLPEIGHCPECNYPYERAVNERRWRSWEEAINKGKPLA